jgi:tetratricopeptide (TPR) repeat protein
VDQAMIMVEGGNLAMGEAMITDLLKKHPDIHTVQYGMGVICALHGRLDEAIARFDKAIEIFPYFGEAWYNKATACQKVMDIKNTLKVFRKGGSVWRPDGRVTYRTPKSRLRDFENIIRKESGYFSRCLSRGARQVRRGLRKDGRRAVGAGAGRV